MASDQRVIGAFGEARRIRESRAGAGRASRRGGQEIAARLESGLAWEDFGDSLRDAGRSIRQAEQPDAPGVTVEDALAESVAAFIAQGIAPRAASPGRRLQAPREEYDDASR